MDTTEGVGGGEYNTPFLLDDFPVFSGKFLSVRFTEAVGMGDYHYFKSFEHIYSLDSSPADCRCHHYRLYAQFIRPLFGKLKCFGGVFLSTGFVVIGCLRFHVSPFRDCKFI